MKLKLSGIKVTEKKGSFCCQKLVMIHFRFFLRISIAICGLIHVLGAEALVGVGYATAYFGKWYLGGESNSPIGYNCAVDLTHINALEPLGGFAV